MNNLITERMTALKKGEVEKPIDKNPQYIEVYENFLNAGDEPFTAIFKAYNSFVGAVVVANTRGMKDPSIREDLIQETFEGLFIYLKKHKIKPENLMNNTSEVKNQLALLS
jgi:hypothetical protein